MKKGDLFTQTLKWTEQGREMWFLAKDVANWIEHKNPSKMLNGVDDDEKLIAVCDVTNSYTTSKSRNTQEMWFLTEDGAIR